MRHSLVAVTWTHDIVQRSAGPGENALRYMELLSRAGLTPVLVTPDTTDEVLDRVDGLLLAGGPDIEPARYGETADPRLEEVDAALDELELGLFTGAMRRGLPVLGICRGHQLVNVALGGTLRQHVEHPQWGDDPAAPTHEVQISLGTHLHRALGVEVLPVNSGHHQAIDRLATTLTAAARSPDGLIEAVESADGMVTAVQWHPEEMPAAPASSRLMESFAGRVRAPGRS